jgi:membrane-associated phospholipid phosphatase
VGVVERQTKELIGGFFAAAASLALFAWLSTQVFRNSTIAFDAAVRDGLHEWASPVLTMFFRVVTQFGSERVLVPVGAVVVWRLIAAGRRRAAIVFVVAAAGAEALDFTLKVLFRRQRPAVFFGLTAPATYSFPSGHAMLSACFYGVLAALIAPRMASVAGRAAVWAAAAAAAVLIGTSRIYLGVHYPSDVIAGYAAAIVWVFSVRAGYRMWLRRATALSTMAVPDTPSREGAG